jgi:hypothetical protein
MEESLKAARAAELAQRRANKQQNSDSESDSDHDSLSEEAQGSTRPSSSEGASFEHAPPLKRSSSGLKHKGAAANAAARKGDAAKSGCTSGGSQHSSQAQHGPVGQQGTADPGSKQLHRQHSSDSKQSHETSSHLPLPADSSSQGGGQHLSASRLVVHSDADSHPDSSQPAGNRGPASEQQQQQQGDALGRPNNSQHSAAEALGDSTREALQRKGSKAARSIDKQNSREKLSKPAKVKREPTSPRAVPCAKAAKLAQQKQPGSGDLASHSSFSKADGQALPHKLASGNFAKLVEADLFDAQPEGQPTSPRGQVAKPVTPAAAQPTRPSINVVHKQHSNAAV